MIPSGWDRCQRVAASTEVKKWTRLQNSPRVQEHSLEQVGTTIDMTASAGSSCTTPVGVTVRWISVPVMGQGDSTRAACPRRTGYIKVSSAHQVNNACSFSQMR